MMLGRSALLAATNSADYGNWQGNYSDVSLLLRNGTQSVSLVPFDESPTPKTITAVGNAGISTTVFKYGTSSWVLDGSRDYGLIDTQMSAFEFSGDFTIEGWFWFNVNNIGYQGLLGSAAGADQTGFALATETSNTLFFYGASTSGWNTIVSSTQVPAIGAWHHVAVCRMGSTVRLFYNGTQIGSATSSNFIRSGSSLRIGGYQFFPGGERSFNGYIDDLRITKGIARYTSNFTPPPAELPANITDDPSYNNVSLLLRNGTPSSTLVPFDESPTPKTITAVDNAGISTTVFKYGTSSLAFDGASRFQLAASSAWDCSGGPHTFECWVFLNAYPDGNCRFLQSGANGVSTSFTIFSLSASGLVSSGRPFGGSTGISSSIQLPLSQWVHVALVLNGATSRLFVNGVGTTASVTMPNSTSGNLLHIGQDPTISSTPNFFKLLNGYIDDLRITRNFARYTSNFAPPPAELPNF